ncbi:MAG: uncharacterized protein K0S65_5771 [Labilithrix sp.]|nr:uncharacterized protein [Labilithrix sp.]
MTMLRGVALIGGAALFGLLACKRPAAQAPRARDAFAGVDCTAVKAPAEPDLVAWEPSSRAQLDKLRRQGVVAVRYEANGCEVSLELLPQCVGPKNRYVYSPLDAKDTKIVRDSSELLATIPLGAANVSGMLDGRHALRADVKLVGSVGLPAGTTVSEYDLVGPECKRATHVVGAVYVGGFALGAADSKQVNAKNLFSAPTPLENGSREGNAQICDRAQAEGVELPGCSVPLRLALIPLGGASKTVSSGSAPVRPASSSTAAGPRVFNQNAVERVVRQKQGAVKRKCWESASDSVRRVNVAVTTTIDPRGRVIEAKAQLLDSEGSADVGAAVARCIAGEIQTWQFPEPDKQQVLTLPFHLIRQ